MGRGQNENSKKALRDHGWNGGSQWGTFPLSDQGHRIRFRDEANAVKVRELLRTADKYRRGLVLGDLIADGLKYREENEHGTQADK